MQGPSWGRKPTREAEKDRTEGNPESVVARSSNECSGGKDHQTHWTPGEDGKYKHRLDLVKWESVTLTRTVSVSNEGRSQMYWVEEWHILKKKRTLLLSHWVVSSPMDYIVHQAPLPVEFSRWEYWSGLPFPTPEGLPNIGSRRFFNHWATWEAYTQTNTHTHSLSLSLSNMLMIKLNLPYNSTKMRW